MPGAAMPVVTPGPALEARARVVRGVRSVWSRPALPAMAVCWPRAGVGVGGANIAARGGTPARTAGGAGGGCRSGRGEYCGWDGTSGQYGGSAGRIPLEADAITFSGTSRPAYAADRPGPVFIAQAPSLRISSIAGQAVPEHPTGHADVSLPASTTGPVEVVFATTNVPVGNTIQLRIAPAYGAVIEALSPAIGGTAAAGTAQVSVTLPAGPSTLQASTSYTVVVAGVLDLSQFAHNEAVEKVQVTVALTGATRARVITASGKSYDVPYAALRAAGFQGWAQQRQCRPDLRCGSAEHCSHLMPRPVHAPCATP